MLTAKLILERLDKEGRLLERREQRARSFTKAFIELLYAAHAYIDTYSMTDIDGAAQDVDGLNASYPKGSLMIGSPPGLSQIFVLPGLRSETSFIIFANLTAEGQKIGIQVGTGDVAVTPTDTALSARIAHGKSAGEFEYGGCELRNITFSDPNGEFTIRRYFTNHSGGSITVNEVGIYAPGTKTAIASLGEMHLFLIARDVVSPGVAVADTEILRVTYVPQITV